MRIGTVRARTGTTKMRNGGQEDVVDNENDDQEDERENENGEQHDEDEDQKHGGRDGDQDKDEQHEDHCSGVVVLLRAPVVEDVRPAQDPGKAVTDHGPHE